MEKTENPENSDVSDTTEGETEGTEGDNQTPVINDGDNPTEEDADNNGDVPTEAPAADDSSNEDADDNANVSLYSTMDADVNPLAFSDGQVKFTVDGAEPTEASHATVTGAVNGTSGDYEFTVTLKDGYQLAGTGGLKVSYEDDSSNEQTLNPTGPVEEENGSKKYSIAAVDLTAVGEKELTIAITTDAIKNMVTITKTVTGGDDAATVITDAKYALDAGTETELGNSIAEVTCEQTLTVKFTLADKYIATVTRKDTDDASAEPVVVEKDSTSTGQNYVYKLENITKNTTLTIAAEKDPNAPVTKYAVTVEDKDTNHAQVEFLDECLDADGKLVEGTDLVFTVTPDAGYELAETNAVQYKAGEAANYTDAVKTTENGKDKYTVASTNINGDVSIKVATAKTEYTVSFAVTGAKVTIGEAAATATPEAQKVELGGKVTFIVTPDTENDIKNKIRYVNTKTSAEGAMTADSTDAETGAATYTYTVDENTEKATTLYVNATAPANVAISFTKGSEVSVYEVKKSGTEGDDTLTVEASPATSITAAEDTQVMFIAELPEASVSKISSVKFGDTTLDAVEKDVKRTVDGTETTVKAQVYTLDLTDIYEAVTVAITDELDETKANVANLTHEGIDGYTIAVDGDTETQYKSGQKILTAADSISFAVSATASYYSIDKVEAIYTTGEGEAAQTKTAELSASNGKYTFAFQKDGARVARVVEIKVTVSTESVKSTTDFTINNRGDHSVYEVTGDEKVAKKAGTNNTYTMSAGAQYVEFDVKTQGKFEPVVTYPGLVNEDGESIALTAESTEEIPAAGKTPAQTKYSYSIPAVVLNAGDVITINEKAEEKRVVVRYNANEVDMTAKVSGKEIDEVVWSDADYEEFPNAAGENCVNIYRVPTDTQLVLVVTARDNSTVKTYKIGDETAKRLNAKGGEVKVAVKDNTTVTIDSESSYGEVVTKVGGDALTAGRNGYSVDYGAVYVANLFKGAQKINVEAVTLEGAAETDGSTATVENGNAKITVKAADEGKTLTVKLSAKVKGEGENAAEDTKEVRSFKLVVLPKASKVEVTGVKNGKLTQTIDTEAEYVLKATPKTINLDNITAEVTSAKDGATEAENAAASALVQAKVAGGKLVVITAPGRAAVTDAAKVTLKDKTTGDAVGSFPVDIAEPALKTEKTTVKLVSATDIALNLNLGMSKKVTAPNAGSVWYKVDISTADENAGTEITEKIAKPFYRKAETDDNGKLVASQTEEFVVNSKTLGDGKACDFTVKVSLVQTLDSTNLSTAADADITAATAFTTADDKIATLNAATKKPYITTKLSLKKGTTTVYTGQQDVKIATPQFDKDATWTTIKNSNIVDITTDDQGKGLISFRYENGDIYMTVAGGYRDPDDGSYVSPTLGKHTIRVTADAPNSTVAATATIQVTIVRGIEDISLPAPETLYKEDGKAATLKLAPVFNWGSTDKNLVPKSKKVSYEVTAYSAELEAAVSVKPNGTVTVDKKYRLKSSDDENTFYVTATATDFAGNTVSGMTKDITVTSEMMALGEVCIAERAWDAENNSYTYTVPSRKTDFTSKELDGKYIIVLKKGVAEKDSYTGIDAEDDYGGLSEVIDPDNVTFKSGNKALTIGANGRISVGKVANKVKITATANDGSKKNSKELTININYDQPAQLGLRVERQNDEKTGFHTLEDGSVADNTKKDIATFTGTSDTVLKFTVVQRGADNEGWAEVDQYTNFKLTVSGAKVLNKNSVYGQTQTAVANKAETKVKLVYTTKEGTTTTTTTTEYTIKNEGIKTLNAPKVKASGNLVTDWEYLGYDEETAMSYLRDQTITYTVTDTTPEKTYSGKKWVMVTTDAADRANAKKADSYQALEKAAKNLNGYMPVNEDGTFALSFNTYRWDSDEYEYVRDGSIPAGSYKLQFTFGTVDKDGGFVPDTKTMAVTLKAVAPRKGSYKPVSKVNMSLCDGAWAALKGSGKNYSEEEYSNLRNANFGGIENGFQHYFKLVDGELCLKPQGDTKVEGNKNTTLTADEIAYITAGTSKEAKNDRVGYVDYTVYVDGVGDVSGTAKITVNFTKITDGVSKPLVTYKASSPTIMVGTKNADIQITAGKTEPYIDYAYIPDGQIFTVNGGSGYGVDGCWITVTAASAPAVGSYPLELYVLPEGSYYGTEMWNLNNVYINAQEAGKAAAKQAFETAIMKYGVKLSATVKVTEKNRTGGKISIAKADLTRVFSSNQYNGASDAKHYYVDVPYRKNMECEITEIVSQDKLLDGTNPLVNFWADPDVETNDEYISITVDKEKLEQAVAAGKVKYGQKCSVKATVKFGTNTWNDSKKDYDRTTDKDIKEEVFTFSLTMPAKKDEGAATTYADAVTAVKAAQTEIEAGYEANSWKELYTEWTEQGDTVIFDNLITPALDYVVEKVEKIAPQDTGTNVYTPQREWYDYYWDYSGISLSDGSVFKAPTSQADGYFKAVIRLANAENYDDSKADTYKDITFTLVIPKTMEEPGDVASALNTFVVGMGSNEAYTEAQSEEILDTILADAREAIEIDSYPTLRIRIESPYFSAATDQSAGYITGTFVVWGLRYGGEDITADFNVTIDKLDDINATKDKIDAVVIELSAEASNLTKQAEVFEKLEAAIVNKQFTLSWKQVEKTVEGAAVMVDDWTLTPATRAQGGTIKGTLVLTNTLAGEEDAESNKSVEISIDWTIAPQADSTNAEAAVKAALAIGSDSTMDENDEAFKALVSSNKEADVKTAVLEAANKAVNKDGYTVAYKKKTDPATEDEFAFTPAKYKAGEAPDTGKGEISFTLVMTDSQAEAGATPTEITVNKTEFGPYPELETLAEAKAEVEAALAADAFKNGLTNKTTADDIKTAAANAITDNTFITVSVKNDSFVLTEATFAAEGSIAVTLVLKKIDAEGEQVGDPEVVEVSLKIAKLTQDINTAKTAAEAALDELADFTNADIADDTAVTATKKKITDAVEAVVNTEAYEVTIKEENFVKQAATVNTAGSIKVIVTITEKSPADGTNAQSVTTDQKTYTIEALDQTIAEAKAAAEAAVKAYADSDNLKKSAADENGILSAVTAVLKAESFDAAWSTVSDEGFKLVEAAAGVDGGEATKGSIKGNIIISDKSDNTSTETVVVSIEWDYVAPVTP